MRAYSVCAHLHGVFICMQTHMLASLFTFDQEPDDVFVAQNKPLLENIIPEGKHEPTKAEQTAKKSSTVKLVVTKQKIKKQAATDQQKTAAAPAKEDAPVKRCTVSFPGARVVLVSAAFCFAITMALRSNSSMSTGAAEVVTTKSVSSWADLSNDQQCEIHGSG